MLARLRIVDLAIIEEVERQHPYSEWARKSLIMTAYANINVLY